MLCKLSIQSSPTLIDISSDLKYQMSQQVSHPVQVPRGNSRIRVIQAADFNSSSLPDTDCPSVLITGDSRTVLKTLPSECVQCTITSPPYWSLRDYSIDGQIGLETSIAEYLHNLLTVFQELYRITREDGTLWLNIGDSYTSGGRTWRATDKKNPVRAMGTRPPTPEGLKPKDLIGIPWRLAFALQESGWFLRTDIIWNKPNCQPESVKDRPTRSHEYLFLFSKSEHYYYDSESVRGPNDRNLRTVWDINTQAYRDAHFATFPEALISPCLALSSRRGDLVLDPFAGSGTSGAVASRMGCRFLGVELNPGYVAIAEKRIRNAKTEWLIDP
jgi:DNA modification methylase